MWYTPFSMITRCAAISPRDSKWWQVTGVNRGGMAPRDRAGRAHAAFQAQGISFDQLIELTDDDLRELGLTIGERKRFRRAVAALRPGLSDDPPPSALPGA